MNGPFTRRARGRMDMGVMATAYTVRWSTHFESPGRVERAPGDGHSVTCTGDRGAAFPLPRQSRTIRSRHRSDRMRQGWAFACRVTRASSAWKFWRWFAGPAFEQANPQSRRNRRQPRRILDSDHLDDHLRGASGRCGKELGTTMCRLDTGCYRSNFQRGRTPSWAVNNFLPRVSTDVIPPEIKCSVMMRHQVPSRSGS